MDLRGGLTSRSHINLTYIPSGRRDVNLGAMKRFVLIALLLIGWVVPAAADDPISQTELVERNGVTYKKFSTTPFTGKSIQWNEEWNEVRYISYRDGLRHGPDTTFCANGQLKFKDMWRRNYSVGRFESYRWCDGILSGYCEQGNGIDDDIMCIDYHKPPNNDKIQRREWESQRDGKRVFPFRYKTWDINGNLIDEARWNENGKIIYRHPKK